MSDTRWSARAGATKALVKGYDKICDALVELADDVEQKADVREEARGYADNMNRLETGILTVFWYHILHRFHGSSQVLQSAEQDLNSAVAIYKSLVNFIRKMRIRFEEFESKGKVLSKCDHYKEEFRRVRQRNRRYDNAEAEPERPQTPVDKFRTGTFLVIVDSIASELEKRMGAYSEIAGKFGFLRTLKDLPNEQVTECAINLQNAYPADLEDSLSDELLQFSSFLNTDFAKKSLEATASPTIPATSSSSDESDSEETESVAVVTKDDDDVFLGVESMELRL